MHFSSNSTKQRLQELRPGDHTVIRGLHSLYYVRGDRMRKWGHPMGDRATAGTTSEPDIV